MKCYTVICLLKNDAQKSLLHSLFFLLEHHPEKELWLLKMESQMRALSKGTLAYYSAPLNLHSLNP